MPVGSYLDPSELIATLSFIKDYRARHQISPTLRTIQEGLGISSVSVVWYRIAVMREKGWLTAERGQPRSLVVTPKGREALKRLNKELLMNTEIKAQILELLQTNPSFTVAQVAAVLGSDRRIISNEIAHLHEAGLVHVAGRQAAPGAPRLWAATGRHPVVFVGGFQMAPSEEAMEAVLAEGERILNE